MTTEEQIRALSIPLEPIPTQIKPWVSHCPGIRAVIFDIYGTIFISGSGDISLANQNVNQEEMIREAMESVGLEMLVPPEQVSIYSAYYDVIQHSHQLSREEGIEYPEVEIRNVWRTLLEILVEDKVIQGVFDAELIAHLAIEYEAKVNPVWPMPHAQGTFEMLKGEVKMGIVSNAQFFTPLLFRSFFERSHTALGFERELCLWSYEHGEAKPGLGLFERLLKKLEDRITPIEPQEILYVGNDMLNDIWAAHQLGLRTCLFAGDQRSLRLREDDPRCDGLEPNFVITDLHQIIEILGFVILDE